MNTANRNPAVSQRAGKFSILAGLALGLAVIPCCPMGSLLGGVLGVIALKQIKMSDGRLRGSRVAGAAAIVGCILSLASTIALNYLADQITKSNNKAMTQAIVGVLEAAAAERNADVQAQFVRDAQQHLTDADMQALGARVRDSYGKFQRFAIASTSERGMFSRQIDVAGVYVFDRAERIGSATFDMYLAGDQFMPQVRLRSMVIEDAELGNLELPRKPPTASQPSR